MNCRFSQLSGFFSCIGYCWMVLSPLQFFCTTSLTTTGRVRVRSRNYHSVLVDPRLPYCVPRPTGFNWLTVCISDIHPANAYRQKGLY